MISNPYSILGITPETSEADAKAAYRRLVKKYHPVGSEGDVKKFMEVHEAWKILKAKGSAAFNRKVGKLTHKTLFTFRRI